MTVYRPSHRAFAQGHIPHAVYSRNGAHAAIRELGRCEPSRHLAHCAHYVDALPIGSSLRDFNVQRYLSAADAVGAWG